jgi:hypothetical protein
VSHRLIDITKVERYSSVVPFDIAAAMPVGIPSLAEPARPVYAYRFECKCNVMGTWQPTREAALDNWVQHVGIEDDRDDDIRDVVLVFESRQTATVGELMHIADEFGGPNGLREAITENSAEIQEIVRLVDQLGAKLGMSGLAWLRGLAELDAAHPALTSSIAAGCPDCGRGNDQGHDPTCFYYVAPADE